MFEKKIRQNVVYFSKLKENAIIPYKKDEDAGYDIYACFDEDYLSLEEFETKLIPTGIAWGCSKHYYMQFHERSSCASKGIKYNGGVIDSGYRGEFKVAIFNATRKILILTFMSNEELFKKYPKFDNENKYLVYNCHKAIAEGVIHRNYKMKIKEIPYEELKTYTSQRQTGGFGSTNKKGG